MPYHGMHHHTQQETHTWRWKTFNLKCWAIAFVYSPRLLQSATKLQLCCWFLDSEVHVFCGSPLCRAKPRYLIGIRICNVTKQLRYVSYVHSFRTLLTSQSPCVGCSGMKLRIELNARRSWGNDQRDLIVESPRTILHLALTHRGITNEYFCWVDRSETEVEDKWMNVKGEDEKVVYQSRAFWRRRWICHQVIVQQQRVSTVLYRGRTRNVTFYPAWADRSVSLAWPQEEKQWNELRSFVGARASSHQCLMTDGVAAVVRYHHTRCLLSNSNDNEAATSHEKCCVWLMVALFPPVTRPLAGTEKQKKCGSMWALRSEVSVVRFFICCGLLMSCLVPLTRGGGNNLIPGRRGQTARDYFFCELPLDY